MNVIRDFDWRICSNKGRVADDRGPTGLTMIPDPSALKELEPYCDAVLTDRIVDEGDVITGGGVASSIDLGLHVVQLLAGPEARSRIARQMCYPYQWKR